MRASRSLILPSLLGLIVGVLSCSPPEPSPPLSPTATFSKFVLEEGLQIECVAAEPMIAEPVAMTFDEDGKLWVVEMRGYMTTIDMDGEDLPSGRVVVLSDSDGDGVMDNRQVFMDSLVMPRAVAVLSDGVLIAERKPLWFVEDTNGDGKGDRKTLVDSIYGASGMPEHSPNGLWRGLDNWYYNAKATARYRRIAGEWVKEKTEFRGQWGISHDDQGRLFYNYNWSQLHADLVPPNYLSRNPHHEASTGIDHGLTIERKIFPIRTNPAINRGYIPGTLDEAGKLIEFTSACSPFVYRGTALPEAYRGNAFVCEPTGNLIKRNIVTASGFNMSAYDPNPGKEFLASADERFRPVAFATGPDGALYFADMYRGIVQHGAYMTPYLREQILERKLDRPVSMGRIWRISPEAWTAPPTQALSEVSTIDLIPLLSHEDGWYRDVTQRLLIERKNESTIPVLREFVAEGPTALGRLHALWALEGLSALDAATAKTAWKDESEIVQAHALRLMEPLMVEDPTLQLEMGEKLKQAWSTAPPSLALQIILSAAALQPQDALSLLGDMMSEYAEEALLRDAALSSLENLEAQLLAQLSEDWKTDDPSKAIFLEMLAAATFKKGNVDELAVLFQQLNPKVGALDWQQNAILNGLVVQAGLQQTDPITLAKEPRFMLQMDQFDLDLQRKLRNLAGGLQWPGKAIEKAIAGTGKTLDEEGLKQFAKGRQQFLSICAGCHGNDGRGIKRFGPPLVQSEWVLGDERKLSLILLHGMEGPLEVNGKKYDAPDILPVMPSHSVVDDANIAAILTYIRNEWGHQAGAVARGTVGKTRVSSQGKVVPWTAEELKELALDAN